ncbi:hypothetical protein TcBrA4_0019120 [Trypanosoma cruzi]|nr:hypothetical protein TcBrA4_0019120 [Trypanosoma cruzi]
MFRRCCRCHRHPYAIDVKDLEAAKHSEAKRTQVNFRYVFVMSARRAWMRAKWSYDFFFPSAGKGGPSR